MIINGTTQVGTFSVDSGTVAIIDPCYLIGFTDEEYMKNVMPTCDDPYYADMKGGMVFSTLNGDGVYPIVAEFRNSRIVSLTISFDYEDDEDYYDDEYPFNEYGEEDEEDTDEDE